MIWDLRVERLSQSLPGAERGQRQYSAFQRLESVERNWKQGDQSGEISVGT